MKRLHAMGVGLAMLAGMMTAVAVEGASYQEIGTVANGAYLVQGDDGRFRVEALDATTVVVYDQAGKIVVSKALSAGETRNFALGDGQAVVGLVGGDAKVLSKGAGKVTTLEVAKRAMPVLSGEGPVDEKYTVRLPPFLVGVEGKVEGSAENLAVEVTTAKGQLYVLQDGKGIANLGALDGDVVDIHVTAASLQGSIVLTLHQAVMKAAEEASEKAAEAKEAKKAKKNKHKEHQREHEKEESSDGIRIEDSQMVPYLLNFQAPGAIVLDTAGGYSLDVSLYEIGGTQVAYEHRGVPVLEARDPCGATMACWINWDGWDQFPPEVITIPVGAPGEYVLYFRLAYAEGAVSLEGVSEVRTLDVVILNGEANGDEEWGFTGPLLDIHLHHWGDVEVSRSVEFLLEEQPVYTYSATVGLPLPGTRLDAKESYDPTLLGKGNLVLKAEGMGLGGPYYELVTLDLGHGKKMDH